MENTLIERIIAICKDDVYDNKSKATILKELLLMFHVNKLQWTKSKGHPDGDGKYFPEGEQIIVYSQEADKMWTLVWYSSCPAHLPHKVSHWMRMPEKPRV